ncbi:MAG: hypothetical protein ACOCVG_03160 [Verrucomicrobiota bacterium]
MAKAFPISDQLAKSIREATEANPDLPSVFVKDILVALEEAKVNGSKPYSFG